MSQGLHNNYITIVKAIGIILMVIGHSGCPQALFRFIYLFHMPLFFFCSGIFYRELASKDSCRRYLKKRVKGLYVPFVKWSILFLLLHNLFFRIGIYNTFYGFDGGYSSYTIVDVLQRLCMILFTMNGYEELLGGFWFLRSLFVSCLLIALYSLVVRNRFRYKHQFACLLFFTMTIIIRRVAPDLVFWREVSMGCYGAAFYMLGFLIMPFSRIWQNKYCSLIFCISLLFFFYYFRSGISMGCGYNKVFPFTISAVSGTLLTIYCSKQIEEKIPMIPRSLYYVGNHTLDILALHFLSFRLVSYLLTILYGLDVVHVAEHPVIKAASNLPSYCWIIYCIAGVVIPLILNGIWQVVIKKIIRNNG